MNTHASVWRAPFAKRHLHELTFESFYCRLCKINIIPTSLLAQNLSNSPLIQNFLINLLVFVRKMSSLKHISTVHANGTIPVHKYCSKLTGMTVVIGEVEGPLVSGDFMLGTVKIFEIVFSSGIIHNLL